MLSPASTSVFAAFEAVLIAFATSPAFAKLLPVSPAVTLPVRSAVKVVTFTSKVMLPLSLRAVVPVPFTKPTSLLSFVIVSTATPFTLVVNVCNALSATDCTAFNWFKFTASVPFVPAKTFVIALLPASMPLVVTLGPPVITKPLLSTLVLPIVTDPVLPKSKVLLKVTT